MYLCNSYSILNTDNSAKKHKKKLLRNSCMINYFETVHWRQNESFKTNFMAYHFNFTDECNDLHLLWYLYLVIYSSLLLNAICNYLLYFTTFTFISHCKIVKQTNLFFPLLLVCRNFPNFMYCIFTREHPSYAYRKNFLHF